MYDAYVKTQISKDISDITSLAADSVTDTVFTGLKSGNVAKFTRSGEKNRFVPQLFHIHKKPVFNLQFLDSLDLLLCLSDGQLTAHSINRTETGKDLFTNFAAIKDFQPITAYDAHVRQKDNKLFVAISAKRQIHIYKLIGNKFESVAVPFSPQTFIDNPQIIRWCSDFSIYFASRTDYSYVQLFKNDAGLDSNVGLVHTFLNRPLDGQIISLSDRKLVGVSKTSSVDFYDADGNRDTTISSAKFSEQPISLVYDSPYLVAALGSHVIEIRSVVPAMVIQKIALNIHKPMFFCNASRGTIFISSGSLIYEFASKSMLKENIKNLIKEKQFDLACQLTDVCDSMTEAEKIEVRRKTAQNFFAQKRFEECFKIYREDKTDLLLILHLFPYLIPEKFRTKAEQYSKEAHNFLPCPEFAQNEKKLAEIILSDFLSEKRTELAKILENHRQKILTLTTTELKQNELILELADTVLLKCYLNTRPSLVPSLLRLPDNNCNVDEAAKDLHNAERFDDLYLLYSKKNMRRKALDVLKQQSKKEESAFYGLDEIVKYLQTFGASNFDLIKEYSINILGQSPDIGVKIFATNDSEAVMKLNREQVLTFLRDECVAAVIPYLEHIIFEWNEDRESFHEELVGMYINKVKKLMKDYVHVLSENESVPRAGGEDGEYGIYRKKLIHFLNFSTKYNAAAVDLLLNDNMTHEKAIIYGRLGKHEEALLIYAHVLMDYDLAENHCEKYFDKENNSKIFLTLFKAYTNPSLLSAFSTMQKQVKHAHAKIPEALKLLTRHPDQLDPVEAIQLLPSQTSLSKVWPALEAVMYSIKKKSTMIQLQVAASQMAVQKAEKRLKMLKSEKFIVDFSVTCSICDKTINSAFVRWKSGKLAHHSCYVKQTTPTTSPEPAAIPNLPIQFRQIDRKPRTRTVSMM